MKGKYIRLSDFLSQIKEDKCNPHKIIPISFHLQECKWSNIISKPGLEYKKQELLFPKSNLAHICGKKTTFES